LLNLLEKREPYRDAFLHEKAINTDIYAVRFVLIAVSLKMKFLAVRFALCTKSLDFDSGTLAFFRIDLF
jgi:hypothetical protein